MKLKGEPFKIDFLGNDPEFKLRTTPHVTEGKAYSIRFSLTKLTVGTLTLTTPYVTKEWIIVSTNTDEQYEMRSSQTVDGVYDNFMQKLRYDYDLNRFFDIDVDKTGMAVYLTLTRNEVGKSPGNITLKHTPAAGQTAISIIIESVTNGVDRTIKDNYKIVCWFEVAHDNKIEKTPALFFDDNNGWVSIGTKILSAYLENPSIPRYGETTGVFKCLNSMMTVKMLFAEMYGGEVKMVQQSLVKNLINGNLEQYCRDNNIPDWISSHNEKFWTATHIDIFGQDNSEVISSTDNAEQYIYIANFTDNAITKPYRVTLNREGELEYINEDFTNSHTLTFPPMSICRVPVGLEALGVPEKEEILFYQFDIKDGSSSIISRSYVINNHSWNAHNLLVLNRLNLYESFIVFDLAKSLNSSGERTIYGKKVDYNRDDIHYSYKVRTGYRTSNEIKLMSEALAKKNNLLIEGQYAWRIAIIPGTWTVMDESNDLLDVEFEFEKTEKINRNEVVITTIEDDTIIESKDDIITYD